MTRHRRLLVPVLAALAATLAVAPAAHARGAFEAATKIPPVAKPQLPAGAQTLKYRFGPMEIKPGQNIIDIDVQKERPNVNGWIVGFRPGLVRVADGKSPSVDEVHLHHAVWLVDLKPVFAAGEEKTYFNAPQGFGWRYTTRQSWLLNHMIHELRGSPERVYLTYEIDFIPDTAPQASAIKEIKTQWMDVQGIKPYPVFNATKGSGRKGVLRYPDQAKNPYADGKVRNRWVVDRDTTAVVTAGHLHPGGLNTDLWVEREGRKVNIFRSQRDLLRTRRRRLVGRRDDRDEARLAGRTQEGRRRHHDGRLRHEQGLVVRGHGHHGRRRERRPERQRRGSVHGHDRQGRRADPRPAARRTSTPAGSPTPACRTRSRCATARESRRSRSRTSSTSRATSPRAGARACRRSSAPGSSSRSSTRTTR